MSTKLQTLATFWQNFGLANVQKGLDEVATEITVQQDESDTSRKALIELLRDFKKTNSDEVKQAVSPVVKTFQNEIDALAKRAKAAEKAFFDIYQTLSDVPDPLPILDQAIERNQQLASKIQDYEIETKQLRETMGDQANEITELKTKEKKMQELQSLVAQYDKNIDETMKKKLADEVENIRVEFDEKFRLVEDQKEELAKKFKDSETVTKTTQRQLEQTQSELYDAANKLAQKSDAKSEEVEMLLNDLESSNQRAILAEKEAESLREQLKSVTTNEFIAQKTSEADVGQYSWEVDVVKDLESENAAKDKDLSQLTSELNRIQEISTQTGIENRAKIMELEEINKDLSNKLSAVELKVSSMSDYETTKKDLSILRSLEFGDSEESEQRPLEVMILERSKALQIENTSLRMDKERLTTELESSMSTLNEKVNETEKQSELIVELEDHVEKLQDHVNRGEAEGRSSTDVLYDLDLGGGSKVGLGGRESPAMSITSTSTFFDKNADATTLLPIIQAQRERYKKRNEELEDQQSDQMQQLNLLQSEIKDLQTDNVKLYEKIRYLQGYQGSSSKKKDSISIPVETKYKNQYEQKIDPFTSFSNQEKSRKYSQLNIVEKIILSMVHFMLSNKIARLFVFAYILLLHGLVFLVLMRMAYTDSSHRTEWQQKYADHMVEAHQEINHG